LQTESGSKGIAGQIIANRPIADQPFVGTRGIHAAGMRDMGSHFPLGGAETFVSLLND
jgi:hypothetical protein